ncbi:MAG: hypothetical protein GXX83_03860 [Gaiellales bacterium]|nr:hypothetical protein [Gaiellales bacterium]
MSSIAPRAGGPAREGVGSGWSWKRLRRLLTPVRLPAAPPIPGALALLVLRFPLLVPVRLRWRTAASGLGLAVATLCEGPVEQGAGRSVGGALEGIGEAQGRALQEALGYGATLLECARAVALANRLYHIQALAVPVSPQEAQVVTLGCPWSRQSWWGKRPCGAFSRYEAGLVRGLNNQVSLTYSAKRTRGDDRCVGVYRWR